MRVSVLFLLAPFVFASIGCSASEAEEPASADSDYTSSSTKITKLAAGSSHTCAIVETGAVRCWGWNGFGQLGIDSWNQYVSPNARDIPAVDLEGHRARAIGAHHHRSCALLDDNRAACWGDRAVAPQFFRLDDRRTAVAIAVGQEFQCALFDDGAVKCWGEHSAGQLGRGSPFGVDDPHGADPIDLGSGARVKQIEAGGWHACALLESGAVKCWGGNEAGQLGQGTRGDGVGRGFFSMGDRLPAVDLGSRRAISVTAGADHSCALLDDHSITCWGSNAEDGALGATKLPAGFTAAAVDARGRTTCALLTGANDEKRVTCWGLNDRGQLGLGDKTARSDGLASIDLGESASSVTAIVPGGEHTCALFAGGRVKCWGMSLYGDLGIGRQGQDQDVGDQPGEMGAALPFVTL
jgi:hypothetical protein